MDNHLEYAKSERSEKDNSLNGYITVFSSSMLGDSYTAFILVVNAIIYLLLYI